MRSDFKSCLKSCARCIKRCLGLLISLSLILATPGQDFCLYAASRETPKLPDHSHAGPGRISLQSLEQTGKTPAGNFLPAGVFDLGHDFKSGTGLENTTDKLIMGDVAADDQSGADLQIQAAETGLEAHHGASPAVYLNLTDRAKNGDTQNGGRRSRLLNVLQQARGSDGHPVANIWPLLLNQPSANGRPMRIAQIATDLPDAQGTMGGIVDGLSKGLASLGHQVALFLPLKNGRREWLKTQTHVHVSEPFSVPMPDGKTEWVMLHKTTTPGQDNLPVYWLDHPSFSDGNPVNPILLAAVAREAVNLAMGRPDIIHFHENRLGGESNLSTENLAYGRVPVIHTAHDETSPAPEVQQADLAKGYAGMYGKVLGASGVDISRKSAASPSLKFYALNGHYKQLSILDGMAPISEFDHNFLRQRRTLKDNGVRTTSSDLWWGIIEPKRGSFDWSYAQKYAKKAREAGLKWHPILSTHQAGGNVNDNYSMPLPSHVWESSSDPIQEMMYVDKDGNVDPEVIAPWYELAYESFYRPMMRSFAKNLSQFSDVISGVALGGLAAGEVRHASYREAAGWKYPEPGNFHWYSKGAQRSRQEFLRNRYQTIGQLNKVWNKNFKSFEDIQPLAEVENLFSNGALLATPEVRDTLEWWQGLLENHLDRMMALAREEILPHFPGIVITAKISGIHWLHNSPTMPRAAEIVAGYVDYARLLDHFKTSGAALTYTAAEMHDRQKDTIKRDNQEIEMMVYSGGRTLALEIARLAFERGIRMTGENAMPMVNGEHHEAQWFMALPWVSGFTYLRVPWLLQPNGDPHTQELIALFRETLGYVVDIESTPSHTGGHN